MAEPVRHRQTKGAATDMFDLQPPRHISTLRIPPVAGRSSEGALTEPTADARACRWELVKVPDRAATRVNRRRIVIPSGRRSADPEPSQSKRRGA
jgi:hypothetical protein